MMEINILMLFIHRNQRKERSRLCPNIQASPAWAPTVWTHCPTPRCTTRLSTPANLSHPLPRSLLNDDDSAVLISSASQCESVCVLTSQSQYQVLHRDCSLQGPGSGALSPGGHFTHIRVALYTYCTHIRARKSRSGGRQKEKVLTNYCVLLEREREIC